MSAHVGKVMLLIMSALWACGGGLTVAGAFGDVWMVTQVGVVLMQAGLLGVTLTIVVLWASTWLTKR